jgi:hypothetical protein
MFRAILYSLIGIFVITLVRLFIGIISKAFRESLSEASGTGNASATGELRKCAVCGAYSPASAGMKVREGGPFLCSDACAGKWRG